MYISIDYSNAVLQANKLAEIAEEYNSVLQIINKQMSAIQGVWEGNSAEAYKKKLSEYSQQNMKIQNEMKQTSYLIKQVARIIKEADEAASKNTVISASGN